MYYGQMPKSLGIHHVECDELMFYQYLPIKFPGYEEFDYEERLWPFNDLVAECMDDFETTFGQQAFIDSYVYLTAKKLFQLPDVPYNREGYHSDGFLTDDINYIWSDSCPTIFNCGKFDLTPDHWLSLLEMQEQAKEENEFTYANGMLVRLDQYNIHRVGPVTEPGVRTFFKLSISKDQYNLKGNAHNYLLDYSWPMKERSVHRNHPSK